MNILEDRKIIIGISIMAAVLSIGIVSMIMQFKRAEMISTETAQNFAYIDAVVKPENVKKVETKLEEAGGIAYYAIGFETENGEYDYQINAKTGEIITKTAELSDTVLLGEAMAGSAQPRKGTVVNKGASVDTGLEDAKKAAVQHAGLNMSEVTFDKAKKERDEGRDIYEIDFYKYGVAEYEYEIDAHTGEILDSDRENWEEDDDRDDEDDDDNDDEDDD
ncbi:MAG: PepSY domain-containing protein [Lachnospiraceae bacterium]|nr:PepSY domain-containing protein [Lachnospiraceae bacterium]